MLKSLLLACLLIGLAYYVIGSPVNNLGEDGEEPKGFDTEIKEQGGVPLNEGIKKYLEELCLS